VTIQHEDKNFKIMVQKVRNVLVFISLFLINYSCYAQSAFVHDPVMIRQDSVFYVFCTGNGISCFSSKDMKVWKQEKPVFSSGPQWAMDEIPGFKGHIWAPDISFYKGKYRLFYSVSAFGKNTSCIGLAENVTLNPSDPKFLWVDKGKVIQSVPGRDDWNAIDPNMVLDNEDKPWLCFGSFWSGIKLVKLNDDLSGPAHPETWFAIASRPRDTFTPHTEAGEGAIEAPFIFKHDKYYYLFVSFDYCCRGIESNYKVMVGRSTDLTGPYLDKTGRPMLHGGGSLVISGNKAYPGAGHNGICSYNGQNYIVFHAYNAAENGRPELIVKEMKWDQEGWPVVDF
jgi:arabinan endo-1,5-alpha-L-arabinosidase